MCIAKGNVLLIGRVNMYMKWEMQNQVSFKKTSSFISKKRSSFSAKILIKSHLSRNIALIIKICVCGVREILKIPLYLQLHR